MNNLKIIEVNEIGFNVALRENELTCSHRPTQMNNLMDSLKIVGSTL
jgi:hypothetical protein